MALRVGGGGGGGGGGGRGKKNRHSPYGRAGRVAGGGGGGSMSWNQQETGGKPQAEGNTPDGAPVAVASGPQMTGEQANRPTLPPHPSMKKFTNRARLFFGNLPRDFSEDELKKMLSAHGEVQEIYHNREKNFGFARMVSDLFLAQMM